MKCGCLIWVFNSLFVFFGYFVTFNFFVSQNRRLVVALLDASVSNVPTKDLEDEMKATKNMLVQAIQLEKWLEVDQHFLRDILQHHDLKTNQDDMNTNQRSDLIKDAKETNTKAENLLEHVEKQGGHLMLDIAKAAASNKNVMPSCHDHRDSEEKNSELEFLQTQIKATMAETQEVKRKLRQINRVIEEDIASLHEV